MPSLINNMNYFLKSEDDFLKNIRYGKKGYYLHKKIKGNYKVTVVLPVYNSEDTIIKTIESIIDQSIGFENIQLLIVDDLSIDTSRKIILDYSRNYNNIFPVFLEKNSGNPGKPRNIGIDFAIGKYTTFIDADDWFNREGLEVLNNLMEKTKDNYAIGKTIKKSDKNDQIIGEYNSQLNRESINPYSIAHIFHHLGPTGRMMNTTFLKEKGIKFPSLKFAEDKQFFIDVITQCDTISTTDSVVYYANRYSGNESLTTTTTIFEKTDANIALINYVQRKKLPLDIAKMILNRLYEFDCITRLFDRHHFLNSGEKEMYYEKFAEVINTTKNLSYDFTEMFFEPWHKTFVDLFIHEKYDDLIKLIEWNKKENIKDFILENNLPYYKLPLKNTKAVRMNMLALHHSSTHLSNQLVLKYEIFGEYADDVEVLVMRNRSNALKEIEIPIVKVKDFLYESVIPYELFKEQDLESYSVFIRYKTYFKVPIKMNTRKIIKCNKKKIDFYTTVSDNFGISLK